MAGNDRCIISALCRVKGLTSSDRSDLCVFPSLLPFSLLSLSELLASCCARERKINIIMSSSKNNSSSFRQQAPAALSTSLIDSDYDYNAATGTGTGTAASGINSSGGPMKSPVATTATAASYNSNIRTTPTSAAAHYTAAALRAAKEKAAQDLHKLHIDNLEHGNDYYFNGGEGGGDGEDDEGDDYVAAADGEEALLDLVQLEELHQEAERMKALGNKHMAAQGMYVCICRRFSLCFLCCFLMIFDVFF
jgi:hypothetical protein